MAIEARPALRSAGPRAWQNPGAFTEKFEVKKIGGNWTFMIPQQFLADHGVDHSIECSFLVLPDGTVLGDDGGWL